MPLMSNNVFSKQEKCVCLQSIYFPPTVNTVVDSEINDYLAMFGTVQRHGTICLLIVFMEV